MSTVMDRLLAGLRAAAEPTRLRILALLADGELTVSEIVQVLGQSQPRVSRHLKLLCDAGLLDRLPEGQWVFYRLAEAPPSERETGIARLLAALVPAGDTRIALDAARLKSVKAARAEAAASYFAINAKSWDRIRSLYVDDREVEAALVKLLPNGTIPALLDIGTGTGRVLECLAGRFARGTGVDSSRDMLAVARARLAAAGLSHCQVRQADMYALPMTAETFDAVTLHLVLHYADRPAAAIAEAARVLKPGGTILVFDKFLRPRQHAWLRRALNPLTRRLATRMDVVFEEVLREVPQLRVISDTPLLAGGWFRGIVLRKI